MVEVVNTYKVSPAASTGTIKLTLAMVAPQPKALPVVAMFEKALGLTHEPFLPILYLKAEVSMFLKPVGEYATHG